MYSEVLSKIITLKDAVIAFQIAVAIGAVGWGILLGLATRVGSLRELFRITSITNKYTKNTKNKGNDTTSKI